MNYLSLSVSLWVSCFLLSVCVCGEMLIFRGKAVVCFVTQIKGPGFDSNLDDEELNCPLQANVEDESLSLLSIWACSFQSFSTLHTC